MQALLMSHYGYLVVLGVCLTALVAADAHWRLAIWRYPRPTLVTLVAGISFFLVWDVAGIMLRIFSTNQAQVSGWHIISPSLPIEEILFLFMFCYATLLFYLITKPSS